MKRILLPDFGNRRLVFYLAMEEYVAAHVESGDAMFFWRVEPTVIFGRNQVMGAEVDVDWCREHGVRMYRRKSGGGCVYSDRGNLMISYVSSQTDVAKVFGGYLSMLCGALRGLGVDAEVSGRNDIVIGGRKVSGNAFQLVGNRSVVHGTLLYDSDFAALERAITPSESKLALKGVSSVRQRVVNLRSCLDDVWRGRAASGCPVHDMDSLIEYLASRLCDGTVVLGGAAVEEISEIERTYLDPDFIAGRSAASEVRHFSGAIPGIGNVSVELTVTGGKIARVHLSGDYFALGTPEEIDAVLTSLLRGAEPGGEKVSGILSGADLSLYVPGLGPESLAALLMAGGGEM